MNSATLEENSHEPQPPAQQALLCHFCEGKGASPPSPRPAISMGVGLDCNGRCDALDRPDRPERRDLPEALDRVSLCVLDRPDFDLLFRAFCVALLLL